jgi:D-threonine aldolase
MDQSYRITDVDALDTPALVFYEDKIRENIARIGQMLGGYVRLRPHLKTHKCREVLRMQMAAGVDRVKCATLKEVELAASEGIREVLLAYPIVGPLARKAAALQKRYPHLVLDVLADDPRQVPALSNASRSEGVELGVMVDVNSGMNRTGLSGAAANDLIRMILRTPGVRFAGLHTYGSPPAQGSPEEREQIYRQAIQTAVDTRRALESAGVRVPRLVAGCSPDFLVAAKMDGVDEVSPGTWIFWDKGYDDLMPGRFLSAALVLGRVISRPTATLFTVDAGYKSVSADPPLPHAHFPSVPGATAVGRWEEHLLVRLDAPSSEPSVGTPVYIVPVHVCSTVNLWDDAVVVNARGVVIGRWKIEARGH